MNATSSSRRRVGLWVRVSTEMQAQGDSPETHERRAREYAAGRGWDVATVYRLHGVSGAVSLVHPEAARMLADVESGRITALIASKFARIARDGIQFRLLHRRFRAAGADLISLDENIDTSTAAGELILGLIADLAEWERKEIASRLRASIRPRAQAGRRLGGVAPFGYQWVDRRLIVDPAEAPVRRLIHELYAEHGRKQLVADRLNALGHRTRRGGLWTGSSIGWLIKDPTAKGLHRANYWVRVGDEKWPRLGPAADIIYQSVEPVVPAALWEAAHGRLQAAFAARRRVTKAPRHVLAGAVNCGCGNRMYTRQVAPRYRCCGSRACRNGLPVTAVESAVAGSLARQAEDPGWIPGVLAQAHGRREELTRRVEQLRAEADRAKEVVRRAFDLYLAGELPRDRYALVCEPHEAALQRLEAELPALEQELALLGQDWLTPAALATAARELHRVWREGSFAVRRQLVELAELRVQVPRCGPVRVEWLVFPGVLNPANDQRTV